MAFVLGNQDFQQIRTDREQRALEAERINARNFAEDAQRLRRPNDPVNPQGQGLGPPMKPNQVGLTAAQAAAKAEYEKRIADAKAARQVTRFPADANDPNSPNAGYGPSNDLRNAGLTSRVGTAGIEGIRQINPEASYPVIGFQTLGANVDMNNRLRDLRQSVIPAYPGSQANRGLLNPVNLAAEGLNQVKRFGEKYLFADRPRREEMDREEAIHQFFDGGPGSEMIKANPSLLIEAEKIGAGAFYDKYSGGATVGVDTGRSVEPRGRRPDAVFTAAPTAHNAITFLESRSGANIPKWSEGKTSSGIYGATDGTATKHGIRGVYVAKLKGLTPGSDEYNAEKDRAAAGVLDHYLGLYPNDPARVAMSYRFGTSAGKNWDGTEKGIRARAKKVRGVDGDEAVRYIQAYVDRQSAPVTAGVDTTQVAADAPSGTKFDIRQGRRTRTIDDAGVTGPDAPKSVAKEMATTPDLSNIKEPDIKMPFGLRTQELNTLMAQRRELKLQAISQLGRPGSAAALKANSDLSANGAMIQNMSQTQALNTLQISNDPRMLNQILNRQDPGANIRISPNSDGTFRVEMGGRIIADRKDKGLLISELRRKSSVELQKALTAASASANLETNKMILKNMFEIRKAHTEGNYKLLAEQYKKAGLTKGIENMFKTGLDGQTYVFMARESQLVKGQIVYDWEKINPDSSKNYQRN